MKYTTTVHPSATKLPLLLTLPDFSTFNPTETLQELEELCALGRARVDEIAKQDSHTFASLVLTDEEFNERMSRAYGPLTHLNLAMQTEEVKKVNDKATTLMTAFSNDIMTHRGLYLAHTRYRAGEEYPTLTVEQKKIIDDSIRDFELSGIALSSADKRKLKSLNLKQSRLATRFSNNLMDAMKSWKKYITDKNLLAGVPSESLRAMRDAATRSKRNGYEVSLATSTVIAILSHAQNRVLREEVFMANAAKASDRGKNPKKLNNRHILEEILQLSYEEAKLLGLSDHVEYSLQKKMANSGEEVIAFARELGAKAHAKAHGE